MCYKLLRKFTELQRLDILLLNARLFTVDATSMYTNIDTAHAIQVISLWLDGIQLPEGFPLEAVKDAMALVMKNNIFEWGDLSLWCFEIGYV